MASLFIREEINNISISISLRYDIFCPEPHKFENTPVDMIKYLLRFSLSVSVGLNRNNIHVRNQPGGGTGPIAHV